MNIAVVGCNRGIGLELVKQLKAAGHEVYAFCRKASEELNNSGVKVFENFEVSDSESVVTNLNQAKLPKINQVFHVAGILRSTSLSNLDKDSITEQFLVNALAPITTSKAFLPYLGDEAVIGLVTSRMGSIADNTSGGSYGYRMSKAALNAAGKSLAEDLKEQGHKVLLLHPGYVKTDMTGHTGLIETTESALGLIDLMNSNKPTGSFWHVNGEKLPW